MAALSGVGGIFPWMNGQQCRDSVMYRYDGNDTIVAI